MLFRSEVTYDHRYVFDEIGYNLKPLDIQGVMGLEQIKKLPELEEARRNNFNKLISIFSKYEKYFYLPKATENSDPCWFGFSLVTKNNIDFSRETFVRYLESNRIQTRSYFSGNILVHPGYYHMADKYGDLNKLFPVAQKVTTDCFFMVSRILFFSVSLYIDHEWL